MDTTTPLYFAFVLLIFLAVWRQQLIPQQWHVILTPSQWANGILLVASYGFYALLSVDFVPILASVTIGVYLCALLLPRQTNRRMRHAILSIGLLMSLGILGLFKYYDFFVEAFGGSPASRFILPIGLSFYSFQAISYLLDVNNRRVEPVSNLPDFALYMAYFPRLVAGPIERLNDLMPQLQQPRSLSWQGVGDGLFLILQGMFKKVAVANVIGMAIAPIQATSSGDMAMLSSGILWVTMLLYTLQLYLDFSGYMDIARGVSKCLGIELSMNFAVPYFAARPVDFWNRWHITLSNWLRDYLFMPTSRYFLKRIRSRNVVLFIAYFVTMTLSGLWHGAGWNFVLWGFLHGVMLFFSRLLLPGALPALESAPDYAKRAALIAGNFFLLNITFVFFALPIDNALAFLIQMFSFEQMTDIGHLGRVLVFAMVAWLFLDISELWGGKRAIAKFPSPLRGALYAVMVALSVSSGLSGVETFIYGQF